jgi:putative endonuclease
MIWRCVLNNHHPELWEIVRMGRIRVIKLSEKQKKRAFVWGMVAEWMAIVWLFLHGYRILRRRYRSKHGEIDIIARRGDMLIFVEVKARRSHTAALESVSPRQMIRIERAASAFASRGAYVHLGIRFDVITCVPWRLPRHLKDAWRPLG